MAVDMTTHEMLDDVNLTVEEKYATNAFAIAGYVNGRYANWPAIVAKYGKSGKFLLSVDVQGNPADGAQCLDIETGDARVSQAPGWFKATQAAGKAAKDLRWYPKLYTSANNVAALIAAMEASGIKRDEYLVWSAHYTDKAHICGPKTCGYPQADATQWTSDFQGVSLDASLCYGYFFAGPGDPVPSPLPVSAEPTLKEGDKGDAVTRLQAQLRDSGIEGVRGITVDGVFQLQTLAAVRNFQKAEGLAIDGIAGPLTWARLDAVSPYKAPEPPPAPKPPVPSPPPPSPQPPPEVLVYVQEVVDAARSAKLGLPVGTILYIPHTVKGI